MNIELDTGVGDWRNFSPGPSELVCVQSLADDFQKGKKKEGVTDRESRPSAHPSIVSRYLVG